ncbi:hypothetical protein ACFFU8_09020 [Chromobacterium piscinae]|uniref:hypothetical protein n=1 Tax=Chromobacterium piscinae TaxID=686831 RepID=UPI001E5D4B14|nr:hypothetical protein [Chromobacterium piscinae]MCD5327955.1 hypothetical protein [Chromobacterium piscinae]
MCPSEMSQRQLASFSPTIGNHPFIPNEAVNVEAWRTAQHQLFNTRSELLDLLILMVQVEDDAGLGSLVMDLERFVSRHAGRNPVLIPKMENIVKTFLSSPGNAGVLADMLPLGHA